MGSMFRSEEMALCQFLLQPEAAYLSVAELGEIGVAQFRDMNPNQSAFQRKYTSEVKRCDEMERRIKYIYKELRIDGLNIPECIEDVPRAPNAREIIDLEALLEKTENEIIELSENNNALYYNYKELMELKEVLEKSHTLLSIPDKTSDTFEMTEGHPLGFVAGVIRREKIIPFEKMLWRVSRGNVYVRQASIEKPFVDPRTGESEHKLVFIAFFPGRQLKDKFKKVAGGFHASLYPCPENANERLDMLKGVSVRIEDLKMVLNQTKDQRERVLINVAREVSKWGIIVRKIKAIYHTLNMFDVDLSKKCLLGEAWIPIGDLHLVQKALVDGSEGSGSTIPSFLHVLQTKEQPPTYNRLNKFTRGFQTLIDSYGVASYREVNPAFYTIITFPFLFAVMFGDLGHAILLLLFALYMVLSEKKYMNKNIGEVAGIFFGGRYIILLMGLFSCFTGLMYNDVFSKTMNIFGSAWSVTHYNVSTVMENPMLTLNPSEAYSETVYFMGVDPAWMLSTNKIIFLNSYKMKMSIIIGVVHMIFGVCLGPINHFYFRKPANFFLEFIPQLLFLLLLFGYMVFMMFFKWLAYSAKSEEIYLEPTCAPSVLILFINMMLFGSNDPEEGCKEFMFEGQKSLHMVLVLVALLCIPWMLLGKPIYEMLSRKSHSEEHEEPIGEIFIHQAIHTIEYVLSTISHTASYLRLWALSLAHAQLSEVIWSMVLVIGLKQKDPVIGPIMIYILFYVWSALTIAILVAMEGLSAFLHTLRLHWVEFMSKFYEGVGYAFEPFSFKPLLTEPSEMDD